MRRILVLIAAAVLTTGATVLPMGVGSAAGAAVTVAPATGLVDQQVVTLDGQGFAPSTTVYFCQGRDIATPSTSDCGPGFGTASTDTSGSFSAAYTVSRFLATGTVGTIDCARPAADSCAVLATDDLGGAGNTTVTPITFAEQPPPVYSIHGTVVSTDTQLPVAGVQVWAYTPTDGYVGSLQATTAADGSYALANTVPGVPYRVLFISPDPTLASQWWSGQATRGLAYSITLRPDNASPAVNASLRTSRSVSGRVTDTAGHPVAGVSVGLYTFVDTYLPAYGATTDANGVYSVAGVASTSYRVFFRPPSGSGLAVQWYNGSPRRYSGTDIAVFSGVNLTGIDAQLVAG